MSEERKTDLDGRPESVWNGEETADGGKRPDVEDAVAETTESDAAGDAGDMALVADDLAQDAESGDTDAPVEDLTDRIGPEDADTGADESEENLPPADAESASSGAVSVGSGAPPAASVATEDDANGSEDGVPEMTFTEHLNELRVRLVRCIIAAFVGLLICYPFSEDLFRILMNPLLVLLAPTGGSLIYTGLPEAFFTHLKVAAIAGLFAASPYVFYQLWMFIAPGLYEGERKYIIPIAFFSALCFVTGALFGYFVVFPFGFDFFLGYASDIIKPMPSVGEYFSFSTSMLFAFGLIFELPLFIFFLAVMGIVTHVSLRKFRKFAILGSFVVSAILTPPDVVSQCFMAGPLCLLYEVGIWVAYVFGRKPKAPQVEDEEQAKA
jgi:sec-independent protein translocase protein TatC